MIDSVLRRFLSALGSLPAETWYESTKTPLKIHTSPRPPQTPAAHFKRLYRNWRGSPVSLHPARELGRVTSDGVLTFFWHYGNPSPGPPHLETHPERWPSHA